MNHQMILWIMNHHHAHQSMVIHDSDEKIDKCHKSLLWESWIMNHESWIMSLSLGLQLPKKENKDPRVWQLWWEPHDIQHTFHMPKTAPRLLQTMEATNIQADPPLRQTKIWGAGAENLHFISKIGQVFDDDGKIGLGIIRVHIYVLKHEPVWLKDTDCRSTGPKCGHRRSFLEFTMEDYSQFTTHTVDDFRFAVWSCHIYMWVISHNS